MEILFHSHHVHRRRPLIPSVPEPPRRCECPRQREAEFVSVHSEQGGIKIKAGRASHDWTALLSDTQFIHCLVYRCQAGEVQEQERRS
jgi:hypothetical protein